MNGIPPRLPLPPRHGHATGVTDILQTVGWREQQYRTARAVTAGGLLWLASLASHAESATAWPQFRGPHRNGISSETGLARNWPDQGPPVLWQADGIGLGYSSPVIAAGCVFVTGDIGDDLVISAFDLTGKLLWQQRNGRAWKGPYPGARGTCTFANGRLFHENAHGRVACLDPADGREIWAVNILERFGGDVIQWGMSECLLVTGTHVLVTPGGRKGLMAALDAATGKTVWVTPPLVFPRTEEVGGRAVTPPREDADRAGYVPPVEMRVGARHLIAGASGRHVFLVDAETGNMLWKKLVPARWEVIGMILVLGDHVYFTAPDEFGGLMVQVRVGAGHIHVKELWQNATDNCQGGLVAVNDRLYGAGYRRFRGWFCVDAGTGKVLYSWKGLRKGSVIYADRLLYALAENGELALLEPANDRFILRGRFRLPGKTGSDVWAHPALSDGRLYIRCRDTLRCFNLRYGNRP